MPRNMSAHLSHIPSAQDARIPCPKGPQTCILGLCEPLLKALLPITQLLVGGEVGCTSLCGMSAHVSVSPLMTQGKAKGKCRRGWSWVRFWRPLLLGYGFHLP